MQAAAGWKMRIGCVMQTLSPSAAATSARISDCVSPRNASPTHPAYARSRARMNRARPCKLRAMPRKLFVTTALPYANGPFHIGHIMEYIQADIWVRFQRMVGQRGAFPGRGRRAWRAHHAQGGRRRHHAGAARGAHRGGPAEVPQWLSHRVRPLALDALAREHRAVAGRVPPAEGSRAHLREARRAVLRPREEDVSRGPVHQGRVPELPREGSVRRCVRGAAASSTRPRTSSILTRRSRARSRSCGRPTTTSCASRIRTPSSS